VSAGNKNQFPPTFLHKQKEGFIVFLYLHEDGHSPNEPYFNGRLVIFVFGSNDAGRHGAGAAKFARDNFGAKYGVGKGLTGRSFAIPTKDVRIRTHSLSVIQDNVNEFSEFVNQYSEKYFFWLTMIGCGLAGYKSHQIAPMFNKIKEFHAISFPVQWESFIKTKTGNLNENCNL